MIISSDVTANIQAEAKNLGFSQFGIVTPSTPLHFDIYKKWLNNKYHARMDYLARDDALTRRANLSSNFQDCQSIIVLGYPYPGTELNPNPKESALRCRISAYAQGLDYHDCLRKQASRLVDFITGLFPSFLSKIYIDSGPILERDLGASAGLGWIGRNTCLISPKHGSYFFLVNIFCNVLFEFKSELISDHCGTCHKCLDACPTSCIMPDRTIDACRCISYLTIENKGPIPPDIRPKIHDWVFGCDICQMVCPWNQKHKFQVGGEMLKPCAFEAYPLLVDELRINEDEFRRKYYDRPIFRAKRSGWMRNIAVAAGNCADARLLPDLMQAMEQEHDPMVRAHLIWAIGQIQTESARNILRRHAEIEKDPFILEEIQNCLRRSDNSHSE